MPAGVGARVRAARIVLATVLAIGGLLVFTAPAHAQAAPGGLSILKLANGGNTTASFEVTGPGIDGTATLTVNAVDGVPTLAGPPLTNLALGPYTITEVQPADGSAFQFEQALCNNGTSFTTRTIQVTLTLVNPVLTCTFVNTLVGASTQGVKVVTGDTSTWVRPALLHFSCPANQIDVDLPPIGPGPPGTYPLGTGAIPPGTCTLTETDTGSDGPVTVSMVVSNHGVPFAFGQRSVTFTAELGDDLAATVTNQFPPIPRPEPPEQATTSTTTTIAGSATTIPGGGGETTTTGAPPTTAAATTVAPLPTTGSPTGGLIVAALVAMLVGLTLVARTRKLSE